MMAKQSKLQKNEAKISVIMSVRNGEKTLNRAMESIINQTLAEWEMIVCDDGSSDNTFKMLKQYESMDGRIKVIRNHTSRGLAYSLNRCIEKSNCDILARQDADDYSRLDRFEKQYKFVLAHTEYAIVGSSWYNVDNNGTPYPYIAKSNPSIKDMIPGGIYMHPSWMMRKKTLEKVGFYTVNNYTLRSQDYHLVLKLYAAGMKIYNIKDLLYYYTMDDNNLRRSRNWNNVLGLMWIRWDGYKRNKLPIWCYLYVFKPVLVNIIPKIIINKYYKVKAFWRENV